MPEAAYLRALLADLDQDLPLIGDRTVETVFIGGGTPSLLSGDFYRQLFQGIRQRLVLSEQAEITLEANPGTVEAGRFAGFREAGINRLSIGVQSFNNTHLQALGRIHDASAAIQAAHQAREAGFTTFNLDIMHALPGQTRAQALDDLQQAMALQPTHLSWYELTIEPNTVFFRSPPDQPSPDHMADTEQEGFALLASQGYQRYEVSAFARDGHACRHNLNYWQFGDYLGIGAGAHGKITDTHHGTIHRYQKTRKPEDYLADPQQARRQYHPVAREDRLFEALMNGLRLVEGVRLQTVEDNTGLPAAQWTHYLGELRQQGLLEITDQRVHCTEKGMHHLNGVLARLAEALS